MNVPSRSKRPAPMRKLRRRNRQAPRNPRHRSRRPPQTASTAAQPAETLTTQPTPATAPKPLSAWDSPRIDDRFWSRLAVQESFWTPPGEQDAGRTYGAYDSAIPPPDFGVDPARINAPGADMALGERAMQFPPHYGGYGQPPAYYPGPAGTARPYSQPYSRHYLPQSYYDYGRVGQAGYPAQGYGYPQSGYFTPPAANVDPIYDPYRY